VLATFHVCSSRDLLDSLLTDYSDIFAKPKGLPPPRSHDHRIRLVPGIMLVAVRPDRYPVIQKDELEKQCADMLQRGLIRHSTSEFSSLVLLVKSTMILGDFALTFVH
jgi:hypothetical protein